MTLEKAVQETPALKELEQQRPARSRNCSTSPAGSKAWRGTPRPTPPAWSSRRARSPTTRRSTRAGRDEIVTQWAMKEIERVGLLKMDFLGLSTLTLIQDALAEIKRTTGTELDIDHVPLDDAKTYELFGEGLTYGVFQFESSGMRDILRKAKPQRLDDLIALNALYRPGPLRSGMVDDFIARKGRQDRDQVRAAAARADPGRHLRRHRLPGTGHAHRRDAGQLHAGPVRRAAQGDGQEEPGRHAGAAREVRAAAPSANGINEKKADKIFDLMEHFAGYGFNKSHSTTYAFLAYQTAYLKANYPWHFQAALLTIEAQNTDKVALYLGECRDRGVPVLPPDINESELRFTVTPAGRALRPHGDQERRRGRDRVDARRAQGAGRADPVAAPAVRGPRSAPRQQARLRGAGEGRRARFARAAAGRRRRAAATARAARAADGRASTRRSSTARACSATAISARPTCSASTAEDESVGAARRAAAGRGALDRDRAAERREGSARPVLERPSDRRACRRPQGVRRAHHRRPAGRRRARRRAPTRTQARRAVRRHAAARRSRWAGSSRRRAC